MSTRTSIAAATFAVLAGLTNAHMLLNKPMMFPAGDKPSNGPLNGPSSGGASNYPCKQQPDGSTYDFSFPRTDMPMGSKYTVEFKGGATHGGGSCQFSLSKDLKPTKDSEFKVIHSIMGGCPSRSQTGNAGENAGAIDADKYTFTVPDGLEAGDYTFAWTWMNKIGNREFYMNCAPITISGGNKKRDGSESEAYANDTLVARESPLDKYPNLFLANIPDVDCKTKDSTNLAFPQPGNSVENNGGTMAPPVGSADKCYAPPGVNAGKGGSGGAPAASQGPAPAAAPSSVAAAPQAPASPAPAGPAGMTTVSVYPYPVASAEKVVKIPLANSLPSSAPAGAAPAGRCPAGSQPCTNPGRVVCISAAQFGLCDLDMCAVAQPLAAGTHCSGGKIVRREIGEEFMKHARVHAHRPKVHYHA